MADPFLWRPVAGLHPGDQRAAARAGRRLSGLPGRWRWGVERLLRWWLTELAGMLPRTPRNGAPALAIPEPDVLEFDLSLSPEALGLLEERAALAIVERTPFAPGEVLAAWHLEPDGRAVRVVVRLAPLSRLPATSQLPETVRLDGADGRPMLVRIPIRLLGPAGRYARKRAERRRIAIAGAAVAALLIALVVPVSVRHARLAQEQALLEEDRAVLAPIVRRAAARAAADGAAAEVLRFKARAPSPLPVLDRLSRHVGSDAYLTELRLIEGEGVIGGLAEASAAALPAALEADPLFADVRLTAPVSRDTAGGRQRFELGFRAARP